MLQQIENLKQSLNPRTLYGLIALGVLLGFAFIARMDDAVEQAREVRTQADERLARHGGAIDEKLWRDRAENAESALSLWQATQWSGPTAGFVAAELQGAISAAARSAELNVLSVEVEQAPVELQSGSALQFRLATDSRSGDSVARLLAALAAHQPMIVVDEVNAVFDEQSSGRFFAAGYAPVSLSAPRQQDNS